MAGTVAGTLDLANRQVGISEHPPYSNRVKYCDWYGLIGPWCAMYVSWVLYHSGRPLPIRTSKGFAYVPDVVDWARRLGRWHPARWNPAAGDLVVFQFPGPRRPNHVCFATGPRQRDGRIPTNEGNTGSDNRDGGSVQRRLRASGIYGFVSLSDYLVGRPTPAPEDDMTPGEFLAALGSTAGKRIIREAMREEIHPLLDDEKNTASRLEGMEARMRKLEEAELRRLDRLREQADRIDDQVGP